MLDFIYYPISWILWAWHKAFSWLLGAVGLPVDSSPNLSGLAWALAIMFLTVTVRLILLYPMVKQIRTTQKMSELQPQIKAIQKKYANDRQRMSMEMSKLQKENGVNMAMGCLPMLVQIPVFIGLFHVLRMFNKMGGGAGGMGFTAEQTRNSGNYFFKPNEVQSFLDARLFGAPLSGYISQPKDQYAAFYPLGVYHPEDAHSLFVAILCVTIPMLLISAVATHFNARMSINRQTAAAAANPQANVMNKMMLWFFPIMILGTGVMWHVGLLTYMLTNNIWTFCQQYFLYKKMDKEKLEAKEKLEEARAANAPRPGVKPKRDKHGKVIVVEQPKAVETAVAEKKLGVFSGLFKMKGDGAAATGASDFADAAAGSVGDSDGAAAGSAASDNASGAAGKGGAAKAAASSASAGVGAKSSAAGSVESVDADAKAQRQAAQRARQHANKNRKGKKKKKR
ncbi:membrane protein insertase YidC [Lawsonella clevelandensis]|uniref:Membrane protein insertase YidC n=1 Tax=Lawsonella clevelandensis TaxID=1528099 RepID=A0A5E3ZXU5_9ACTN|nr:membrane protein insertase YidC [Lawsonella clevelandensis]VHO00631.1 Membrane protein insertase YidC [Lawsonella clevelandensis]